MFEFFIVIVFLAIGFFVLMFFIGAMMAVFGAASNLNQQLQTQEQQRRIAEAKRKREDGRGW